MIDFSLLITGGVGILTSIISSWTTWFFTKKKYNAEVDGALLDNMKESLNFYKELSEDNKRRLALLVDPNWLIFFILFSISGYLDMMLPPDS